MSELTPEMLERFRQVGLRLDRAGRLWHEDVEVSHPRMRQAILRWLDVEGDRDVVRLDERRYAYIDVEDSHLRATSLRWDGERPWIVLDDGSEEPLDLAHLRFLAGGAIATRARGGRLTVRLTTAAQQQLADRLAPAADGAAVLRAAGRDWPIAAGQ